MRADLRWSLALLALLPATSTVRAGAFVFASETSPAIVTHPTGYTGTGGPRTVTVCLDPSALPVDVPGNVPTGDDPNQALRNAAAEFTRNMGAAGNVLSGATAGVPSGRADFESVAMHEIGQCLGLGHTAIGPSELVQFGECGDAPLPACSDAAQRNKLFFSNAFPGANTSFDLGLGADNERGSRDDLRGDDLNRVWFRSGVNDPFAVPPASVDRNSYTIAVGGLPAGHSAVEIPTFFDPCTGPSSDTSTLRGQPATMAVMFPTICANTAIRRLSWDEVATLRIARAGNDGSQGTGDDYSVQVDYVGQTASCDIVVRFVTGAGFAFCQISGTGSGNNRRITSAVANFELSVNWWFNQTDSTAGPDTILRNGFE
jgi:hypothetical protein